MRTFRLTIIITLALAMTACNSRQKDLDKMTALEKEVYSASSGIDKQKGEELLSLYLQFADDAKNDSMAPVCLYKAAELCINLNKGEDAVNYFDRVIAEYPDFAKVPDAIFIKGFVYEVMFQNLNKASEAYEMFLKRYPDHQLAKDAEASLNNLGKTPEQILLEARDKAKADSLAAL